jgi:hypothetical protein
MVLAPVQPIVRKKPRGFLQKVNTSDEYPASAISPILLIASADKEISRSDPMAGPL